MNSLSRKHFLRLALAVAAVAAAGSAPNVFAAEDVVEITVAHPYGKIFRPIHQKIIKEFNKIHPNVKVRLETPFPDYEELTQRTLAGIAQGNAPVLSFQGINQIRQYIEMGAAYDLSEFVKNDPRWKDGSGYYPKSRSKPSRYSSENDVLIEKSVKYTDFFLLSIVYV